MRRIESPWKQGYFRGLNGVRQSGTQTIECKISVQSPSMLENSLDAGRNEITLDLPESVTSSKLSFSCSYVPSSLPSKIEVGNFIINES